MAASLFLLQLHFSFVVHFRALCLWRARAGGQLEIRRDCYMNESMLVVDEEAFTAVREAGSWPRSPHSRPAEIVRRPTRPGTMALSHENRGTKGFDSYEESRKHDAAVNWTYEKVFGLAMRNLRAVLPKGANRRSQFKKRGQLFIRVHNETLSVVAMRINQSRLFARWNQSLRRSPNSNRLC